MINFIIALVMGGVVGWLASKVMNTDAQQGIFMNVVIGCVGSMLGGWLFSYFTAGSQDMRDAPFDPVTLAVAFGGAIVLLGIVNLIRRGKVRYALRFITEPRGSGATHLGRAAFLLASHSRAGR